MFCPKCGTEVSSISKMCHNCGYLFLDNPKEEEKEEESLGSIVRSVVNENKPKTTWQKISAVFSVIGLIIAFFFITADKDELADMVSDIVPMYAFSIQDSTPPGYNTSLTYGVAFASHFDDGKWEDLTENSQPIVKYTGICENDNGTYSKVEIFFDITDMDNGDFYYNLDTVLFDGVDLGVLGTYGLMDAIFNTY